MLQPSYTTRRPPRARAALAVLALLAAAWLTGALVLGIVYEDRVLPGTTVAGVALGGADPVEARRWLRALETPARTVVVAGAGRRFTITARHVRLRIDGRRSAGRALEAGRDGLLGLLGTPAAALGLGRNVQPVYAIDAVALERVVSAIAGQVDRSPFQGALSIDAATLRTRIRPPRAGRTVDQPALRRAVASALRQGTRRLGLPVRKREGPSRAAVERVAAQATVYLEAGPVRLRGAGRPIRLDPGDVAPLLDVEPRRGRTGSSVGLGVDDAAVEALIARVAARRDRRPIDARLDAPAAPVLLEGNGSLSWRPRPADVAVRPSRPGRAIRPHRAVAAVAAAVRELRHDVDLPVRRLAPATTTAAARRVRSLIGTFTTRFACCQPRGRNIRLMARAVDRTLVRPGEQFSLNRVAGPRTRARGFVPAPFIADGRLVDSVGGGVSQYSTTMYNAAYFAGLRLDGHQPHSFYIDRYPVGREATLDFGSIDLTWTNDTDAPILVRSSATATSVTVSLYGANGGRRVRAVAGPRRSVAGGDFSITVTRVVRYRNGRVARERYTTTYDRPPAD